MIGGGIPGPGGPGGQPGGQPGDDGEPKDGTLTLTFEDRILLLEAELALNDAAHNALVDQLERQVAALKGQGELQADRSWVHELAAATQSYLKDRNEFPRGALPRSEAGRSLPWRPDQRLSFYAALVPYLGEEYQGWSFDMGRSWNEGRNLSAAQRVIPHLVATRQAMPVEATVKYPGVDAPVGACYFVGMAGIGFDAAEYPAADASVATKRGVFGYDRVTKKADVKDGLDQTIVLIMVPANLATAWLAGGGSTVRGVSDVTDGDNPLEPFVCWTYPATGERKSKFAGKKGTLAIMGDGKVRFLPADMPAATFRALCTIAGNDKITTKLDDIAPVVEDDAHRELKTGGGNISIPKPPDKEPTPKDKEPAPKEPVSNNKGKIEGKWSNEAATIQGLPFPKGAITIEVNPDGSFVQTVNVPQLPNTPQRPPVTIRGTWKLGEGDAVTLEGEIPNIGKKAETVKVVIKDKTMTFTDTDGTITFTKIG